MDHPVVLLVDDYRDALTMWAFYLRTRGMQVVTAADGLSAVRLAAEHLPDVVVLDLNLPGISGLEAARRIRAMPATAHIPLLATTGDTHPGHLDEARALGFVRIMIKPCDPPRLVDEIERALAARPAPAARFEGAAPPGPRPL